MTKRCHKCNKPIVATRDEKVVVTDSGLTFHERCAPPRPKSLPAPAPATQFTVQLTFTSVKAASPGAAVRKIAEQMASEDFDPYLLTFEVLEPHKTHFLDGNGDPT